MDGSPDSSTRSPQNTTGLSDPVTTAIKSWSVWPRPGWLIDTVAITEVDDGRAHLMLGFAQCGDRTSTSSVSAP